MISYYEMLKNSPFEKTQAILHVAQIHSVNPETGTARVKYDDLGGIVSGDLQMLYPAMGEWRMFYMPKKYDHVAVLRLPNGKEEGFILGTFYTASNLPLSSGRGIVRIESVDGKNSVTLDASTGSATLKLSGGINIKCGELTLESEALSLGAPGITLQADGAELTGNVSINGDLNVTGVLSVENPETD